MNDELNYSIAAIPTLYNGRQYRSRLEARWAAFFDQLGIHHEYEPYDLGAWSPDFLLTGRDGYQVLTEVKPLSEIHEGTAGRIMRACRKRNIGAEVRGVLLTRLAPALQQGVVGLHLGWTWPLDGSRDEDLVELWGDGFLNWSRNSDVPAFDADINSRWAKFYTCLLTGYAGEDPELRLTHYPNYSLNLWNAACNAVQWRAGQS